MEIKTFLLIFVQNKSLKTILKVNILKIFDCILYLNEVELLELRLNYLNSFVDYFVIVQSSYTFSGNYKGVETITTLPQFRKFKNKIIKHIDIENPHMDPWQNETRQRNLISEAVKPHASPEDVIIMSDADEIPTTESINTYVNNDVSDITFCEQEQFYYYYNLKQQYSWYGSSLFRAKEFEHLSPQDIRNLRHQPEHIMKSGGWHFAYLGGKERIQLKLQSFAHTEYANWEDWKIDFALKNHTDLFNRKEYDYKRVDIDNFPKELSKYFIKKEFLI